MTIRTLLPCVGAAILSASPLNAVTALPLVKSITIHDAAPSAESRICLEALEKNLVAAGFNVNPDQSPDAEMTVTVSVMGGKRGLGGALFGSVEYDVNYLIKIASIPEGRELFSFEGHQENKLNDACKWMGKRTTNKLLDAQKTAAAVSSQPGTE